ncbi:MULTISPECIES: YciI family protein [unclassified Agarivorans]|uniref:YciI family protein n=1 Tax=unclassified Agarivorans TaxID=2636026 RepID=UPI003D7DEED8
MRKFVAFLSDKNKDLFSEQLLLAHIKHLQQLDASGKLHLCGPFTDNDSAIQILMVQNIEEATALVNQDPFVHYGYYKTVEIKELIEANADNNWLTSHPQTEEKRN